MTNSLELQHYFDVIQASGIVELQNRLPYIQALIRERADWLKSERDPVERVNCEFLLKVWHILEQIALDRISLYYVDSEIAQCKGELSSPAIDSAPPVTSFHKFDSSHWPLDSQLAMPLPIPRRLSRRQYAEEHLEVAKARKPALEAKKLQHEGEFAELMKFLKSNEIPKKPAAESVQMENRV